MDPSGSYTHSTTQDYPSVSQINQKVKENAVNLIFAVTKEQIHIYEQLVIVMPLTKWLKNNLWEKIVKTSKN